MRRLVGLVLVGLMLLPMGALSEDVEAVSLKVKTQARIVEPGSVVSLFYTIHNGLAEPIRDVRVYATEDGSELETVPGIVADGYHVGALAIEMEREARTAGVVIRYTTAEGEERAASAEEITLYTAYLEGMDPSHYHEAEPIVLTDGSGKDLLRIRRRIMPASLSPWPGQEMRIYYTLENLADVALADIIIGDSVFIPQYGEGEPFSLAPGESRALITLGAMGAEDTESQMGVACVPQDGQDVTIMGSYLPIPFEARDMLVRMDLDGPQTARDGEKVVLSYALENTSGYELSGLLLHYGPVGEITGVFSMAPGERVTGRIATTLHSDDAMRHLALYGYADTGEALEAFFGYSDVLNVVLEGQAGQAAPRRASRLEAAAATGLSLLVALPAALDALSGQ